MVYFDPGLFRIGDSFSQGNEIVFDELPTFSPEMFAKVSVKNAMKYKQYLKGVNQLTEEGTIQVFHVLSTLTKPSLAWSDNFSLK